MLGVFVRLQAMKEIQRLESEVENHNATSNEKVKHTQTH